MSDVSLSKAVRSNLLSLQTTASMMNKTQERLATGNKVNSALDNPSNFFTASSLNSRAADMGNLLDSMASGIKVIEAANNGVTSLTKNLESMQSTLRQARQDKSFQTKSFEVTDASVINLVGGQYGDEAKSISLADAVKTAGVKSQLTTTATTAYLGATAVAAAGNTPAQGIGARTVVTNNETAAQADRLHTGAAFKVAGVDVVASGATNTIIAGDIQAKLDGNAATKDKYVVTANGTTGFTIENVDPTAEAAKIEFATTDAATKASTSFNYSAVPDSITVGGQTVDTGAKFEDFVANLEKGKEAGAYTFTADKASGAITITASEFGAATPVTSVPTNVVGVKQIETLQIGGTATGSGTLTIGSVAIAMTGTETAAQAATTAHTFLTTDTGAAAVAFREKYDVTVNSDTLTFTAKTNTTGPTTAITATSTATGLTSPAAATVGTTGVAAVDGRTDAPAVVGAYANTDRKSVV